ncbi:MAG: tetratricopeptide repeat protein [Polyangiaceae bacterium]
MLTGSQRSSRTFGMMVMGILGAACGPKKLPHPPPDGVATATNRPTVLVVDGPSTPLVVDWKAEQRADLEVAMREGIAVVHHDGKTLEFLRDCQLDGHYGFYGVATKQEVVRLKSADELNANLPLSGAGLAIDLGAKLSRGASLDIAMIIVGMTRTTWLSPTRADLKGNCDKATHFVRGATLGAFAMDLGDQSKARTALEIFKIGASASTESSSAISNRDGKLEACNAADPRGNSAPPQCSALIRLELSPLAEAPVATPSTQAPSPALALEPGACAQGFVWSEGKCTPKDAATHFTCRPEDPGSCEKQCASNDAESCATAGYFYQLGKGGLDRSPERSFELASKGCSLGSALGCYNRALLLDSGEGVAKNRGEALNDFDAACRHGIGEACFAAGFRYFSGDGIAVDKKRSADYFTRGCDAADPRSCLNLAVQYDGGDGVSPDPARALELHRRACDGGVVTACGNLGLRYEFGMSVPKDPKAARALFERTCKLDAGSCVRLAIAEQGGLDGSPNPQSAKPLYERACKAAPSEHFGALACGILATYFGETTVSFRSDRLEELIVLMGPQCNQHVARACGFIGVAQRILGKTTEAKRTLEQACSAGDYWACSLPKP